MRINLVPQNIIPLFTVKLWLKKKVVGCNKVGNPQRMISLHCTIFKVKYLQFLSDKLQYYRGSDKSLARPGRKKLHRPNCNFYKLLKKKKKSEGCPSNQVSAAAVTSTSDEKWRPFNCFFNRFGLRTYQHHYMFCRPVTSVKMYY